MWEIGYKKGEIKGVIYKDVLTALKLWVQSGIKVCIYSSGSIWAQKLLFAHSNEGDVTNFLTDYFDTNIG